MRTHTFISRMPRGHLQASTKQCCGFVGLCLRQSLPPIACSNCRAVPASVRHGRSDNALGGRQRLPATSGVTVQVGRRPSSVCVTVCAILLPGICGQWQLLATTHPLRKKYTHVLLGCTCWSPCCRCVCMVCVYVCIHWACGMVGMIQILFCVNRAAFTLLFLRATKQFFWMPTTRNRQCLALSEKAPLSPAHIANSLRRPLRPLRLRARPERPASECLGGKRHTNTSTISIATIITI